MKRRNVLLGVVFALVLGIAGCGGGGGGSDSSSPSTGGSSGGSTSGTQLYGSITVSSPLFEARNIKFSGTTMVTKQPWSTTIPSVKAGGRVKVSNVPYGVYSLSAEYKSGDRWLQYNYALQGGPTVVNGDEYVSLSGMKKPL